MKQNEERQYAGIWLDNNKAIIISNTPENQNGDYSIQETIKSKENHGGGSEHSMNNTKQADNLKYFKALSAQLLAYDELFIFGPGKAQEQFQNYLHQDAQFKSRQVTIDSAEQLTDPQMIAKVRDFFKSRQN